MEKLLSLQHDFPLASETEWLTAVEKALKGAPIDRVLSRPVAPGVRAPALGLSHGEKPAPIPGMPTSPWAICAAHWSVDVETLNREIIEDLEGGASSIAIRMRAGVFPGAAAEDLADILDGVMPDLAGIRLLAGEEFQSGARALLALLGERGVQSAPGSLGADPIGALAQNGRLLTPLDGAINRAVLLAGEVAAVQPNLATLVVDTFAYNLAGCDVVQELALMLVTGLRYLRGLEASGMPLEMAARQIEFKLTADAEIVTTIAKFRAARLAWGRILEACGVAADLSRITGVMSVRMMSVRDPWVNVLRATAAGFGAGLGGADAVTILPHDTTHGVPTAFARRIARNVQVILQNEAGLGLVGDAAAGSYQIETLTARLADAAWCEMQRIEGLGGIEAFLGNGQLHQEIEAAWKVREEKLGTRKRGITGVSEFPDLQEAMIDTTGEVYGMRVDAPDPGTTETRLPVNRDSANFEKWRDLSDARFKDGSGRPEAIVITMGPETHYGARLNFLKNLFASVGVDCRDVPFAESKGVLKGAACRVVVLCGSDAAYANGGLRAVQDLKARGAENLMLVGQPTGTQAYRDAGVTEFIANRTNIIALAPRLFGMGGQSL